MSRLGAVLATLHKSLTTYYLYLVTASVTLQEAWGSLDDYVPPRWRHIVIGGATAIVLIDKVRRTVKANGDK